MISLECAEERQKPPRTREDIVGIPRVCSPLAVGEAAIGHIEAGNRVLALPSFVATYQQRA